MPPAESEIAEAMEVRAPSVTGMLKTLEKKQLIRKKRGAARSIEILVDPRLIPTWKKKIKRTVREWVYTGPPKNANITPHMQAVHEMLATRFAGDNLGPAIKMRIVSRGNKTAS